MNEFGPPQNWRRLLATRLSESFLLRTGRRIHLDNPKDPYLKNNLWHKLLANTYLILADYGSGEFPPKRPSRAEAYAGERAQILNIEVLPTERIFEDAMRKPWVDKRLFAQHSRELIKVIETMEKCGLQAPARILELGCGCGWLSEILAIRGYNVTGTSISEVEIEHARNRIASLKAKKLECFLEFIATPMEEVHRHVQNAEYDAAFCYEALHHVYDWREALEAIDKCLRPGGRLFLFGEPSWLHTFICYRTSKIWKTQEIGFRGRELRRHLAKIGYQEIRMTSPLKRFLPFMIAQGSLLARAYWISARKPKR
jgi:ubiquinone/menaquinone biosynthesis C-methylase UbiE